MDQGSDRPRYQCKICLKTLRNSSSLHRHHRLHAAVKPHACTHCPYRTTRTDSLAAHIRSAHTGVKLFPCVTYECPYCDKHFGDNGKPGNHIRIHTGERPYECQSCGQRFVTSSNLKGHEEAVHQQGEQGLQCNTCGRKFSTKQGLRDHMKRHKGDIFKCGTCNKSFPVKSQLLAHQHRVHTDTDTVPLLQCTYCRKTFKEAGNLKQHVRTHTGERPFTCGECPAAFALPGNLNMHRNAVHLKRKPHSCTVCSSKFVSLSTLRRHTRIHW